MLASLVQGPGSGFRSPGETTVSSVSVDRAGKIARNLWVVPRKPGRGGKSGRLSWGFRGRQGAGRPRGPLLDNRNRPLDTSSTGVGFVESAGFFWNPKASRLRSQCPFARGSVSDGVRGGFRLESLTQIAWRFCKVSSNAFLLFRRGDGSMVQGFSRGGRRPLRCSQDSQDSCLESTSRRPVLSERPAGPWISFSFFFALLGESAGMRLVRMPAVFQRCS